MDLELPPEMPNGLGGDDDDEEEDEDDDRDGLDDSYDLTGTTMPLNLYVRQNWEYIINFFQYCDT